MGGLSCETYAHQLALAKVVKARLARLGIDERSNKYLTLFFRWMRA